MFFTYLLFQAPTHAQGTNNDFDFDQTDLEFLFSKMGYGVFKFPITQSKDQIFDIIIEEYRGSELSKQQTAIGIANDAFKDFGIDAAQYAKPKMKEGQTDSVYFHRLYVEEGDSLLTVHVHTHGLETPIKFDIHDLYTANVRAHFNVKEKIDEKRFIAIEQSKILAFFYANNQDNQPLWCPAGMSKKQLVDQFYYVALISIAPYQQETK